MKVKWKIAKSNQRGRAPSRHKTCQDCGEKLTKYRFEIEDYVKMKAAIKEQRDNTGKNIVPRFRVCPQCVLMAYLNKVTFWEGITRLLKPQKYFSDEVIEG